MFSRRRQRIRKVVLYSRPGCHLCDEARALLLSLGRKWSVEVQEIDITTDPALVRAYDIRIPVLVIDGRIELSAPLNEREVRAALK